MVAVASLLAVGTALADMRIPSSVFKLDELEKAQAKAAADGKPLVFVLTDPGTS
jgi:hypothetical protein